MQQVEDKKKTNIRYIEQMRQYGQDITKMAGYEDWLEFTNAQRVKLGKDVAEWINSDNNEEEK